MFEISTKLWYGLRAVVEIAKKDRPVSVSEIARSQGLPSPYLIQILHRLKRAGILESVRGREGGYRLKKPAEEVSVYDVLVPLAGDVAIAPCLDRKGEFTCEFMMSCESIDFWKEIQDKIRDVMIGTKISDLITKRDQNVP